MRKCFFLFMLLLVTACSIAPTATTIKTVVLEYEDFGPQVIANELIGMYWWQWENHGDSRPKRYPIHVVVYRYISITDVMNKYPVNSNKKIDYRYVKYQDAIEYLNVEIDEDVFPTVTQKLKETLHKIQKYLSNSKS